MKQKKLGLVDLIAISCGQVIGAGVVTLIGTAIVATGTSAWLAYGRRWWLALSASSLYLYQQRHGTAGR